MPPSVNDKPFQCARFFSLLTRSMMSFFKKSSNHLKIILQNFTLGVLVPLRHLHSSLLPFLSNSLTLIIKNVHTSHSGDSSPIPSIITHNHPSSSSDRQNRQKTTRLPDTCTHSWLRMHHSFIPERNTRQSSASPLPVLLRLIHLALIIHDPCPLQTSSSSASFMLHCPTRLTTPSVSFCFCLPTTTPAT